MDELEKLEKRWKELAGKPKTKIEIEEALLLAREIELNRAKEYSGLILELKEVGIEINSIWDLVNTRERYPEAIPALIKYLPKISYCKNKEGIIRALTVKEARGKATPVLIAEYEKTPKKEDNLRWVIGNAIATVMTLQDVEWILSVVVDKSNRRSRGQLVKALGTVKSGKVEDILIKLLNDDEVAPEALWALGKLKSKKAKEKIIALTNHPNKLINKEAHKALKKITKI